MRPTDQCATGMYGELTAPPAKGFFGVVAALFAAPTTPASTRPSARLAGPTTEKQAASGHHGQAPAASALMQQPVAESRADRHLSVREEQDRLTRTTARVCAATDPKSYAAEAEALRAALQASELARENLAQENLVLRAAADRHVASGTLYDQEALKALLPSDLLSEISPAGDPFSVTAALEPAAAADMITSQIWQPWLSSPTS